MGETHILQHFLLTGKMPVLQKVNFIVVEQASCLFTKELLRMV